MSAARLPYYQQLPEEEQRRRSTSRGRGGGQRANGAYHERNTRRDRSRSVERRRYSRSGSRSNERRRYSRSRSIERQRRRNSRHQQHRHHRDSRDRSWDTDRRERDRDYYRRSYYQRSRSRSTTPPSSSFSRRRQSHGGKQGRVGGSGEDNVDDVRMPLPTNVAIKDKAMSAVGAYYNLDTDEPFDKERIHREIEEKLRETLARDGKVYPPPKSEASHPVFANDGSFMELFKKMQEERKQPQQQLTLMEQQSDAATVAAAAAAAATTAALRDQQQYFENAASVSAYGPLPVIALGAASSPAAPYIAAAAAGKAAPPPPMVGRRRGGKILKTGVVAKLKMPNEQDVDPKDFWSLYLAEVNKYKSNTCDTDNGKRPLVK